MDDVSELLEGIKSTMERIQMLGQLAGEIQAKGEALQAKQAALVAEHEALLADKATLERETREAVAEFATLKAKVEALAQARNGEQRPG